MTRKEEEAYLAAKLVQMFNDSGEEYTCLASIYKVVERPAFKMVAGTKIRPRRIINLACDQIHREKHS